MKADYITVTAPPTGGDHAGRAPVQGQGKQDCRPAWDGATTTNVDVFRNGALIATTADDGFHTDAFGGKGGGTFMYKVCEAGTTTCSPEVTASF